MFKEIHELPREITIRFKLRGFSKSKTWFHVHPTWEQRVSYKDEQHTTYFWADVYGDIGFYRISSLNEDVYWKLSAVMRDGRTRLVRFAWNEEMEYRPLTKPSQPKLLAYLNSFSEQEIGQYLKQAR